MIIKSYISSQLPSFTNRETDTEGMSNLLQGHRVQTALEARHLGSEPPLTTGDITSHKTVDWKGSQVLTNFLLTMLSHTCFLKEQKA